MLNFLKFMLYYLSQSYKIQIQNTKYVHARLPTCTPLKLKLLLTIFIQERHSKVNGIQAKASCGRIFWGNNCLYQKPRDTHFLRQAKASCGRIFWGNVSTKNLVTRIFCGNLEIRILLH